MISPINNRNPRERREICSKLTIKTPEPRHLRRSDVLIVNFKQISHFFSSTSIVDFEEVFFADQVLLYVVSCLPKVNKMEKKCQKALKKVTF